MYSSRHNCLVSRVPTVALGSKGVNKKSREQSKISVCAPRGCFARCFAILTISVPRDKLYALNAEHSTNNNKRIVKEHVSGETGTYCGEITVTWYSSFSSSLRIDTA